MTSKFKTTNCRFFWNPLNTHLMPISILEIYCFTKKDLINELSDASKEVSKDHPVEFIRQLANNKDYNVFYNAPTVIIVCGDKNPWMPADCAAATQNILLAAESLGLGACWIQFGLLVFNGKRRGKVQGSSWCAGGI